MKKAKSQRNSPLFSDLLLLLIFAGTCAASLYLIENPALLRPTPIAVFRSQDNVSIRNINKVTWRNAGSEGEVHAGDIVRAPGTGDTQLRLRDGRTVRILPDSVVQLERDAEGLIDIKLLRGSIETDGKLAKLPKREGIIAGQWEEVKLLPSVPDLKRDIASQKRLAYRLNEVRRRTLELEYVLIPHPEPLQKFGQFEDFQVEPVSPPVGTVYDATHQDPCIGFVWTPVPVPGVSYVLELAKTPTFSHFRSFGSERNYVFVKAGRKADYFWRIRAVRGRESYAGRHSRIQVFKPELSPEEKRRQELISRIRVPKAALADLDFCQ